MGWGSIRKSGPKAKRMAPLNRLCRKLVVELRDRNTCQRCGKTHPEVQIQWSHVVSRSAESIQCAEWNSKALCAGCHRWWGNNREAAMKWWAEKWPDREIQRLAWKRQRGRPKIQHDLIRQYLVQRIKKLEQG